MHVCVHALVLVFAFVRLWLRLHVCCRHAANPVINATYIVMAYIVMVDIVMAAKPVINETLHSKEIWTSDTLKQSESKLTSVSNSRS